MSAFLDLNNERSVSDSKITCDISPIIKEYSFQFTCVLQHIYVNETDYVLRLCKELIFQFSF